MSDVRPSAGAGERLWVARLPVTLRSLCLGAWIFAAAGPRVGSARAQSKSEGISIVLAIDLSSSMLSEDFAPANRIDVAKQTAIEFVRERRSDRIGLVAFAAQALTQVPITTDYAVLEQALRDLRIGMLEDGTAIGTGIATAANRLRRAPGKSRVIVLLTDGVNNRGTVDPRTAALAAAAFGIKIYVIGVGTRGEAPVPTGQGLEGLRYQMMPVEIDEPLMTEIARMTGGRYFRATDTQSLRHVFDEINRLEKETVQQVVYRRFDESYRVPLALGLVALGREPEPPGPRRTRGPPAGAGPERRSFGARGVRRVELHPLAALGRRLGARAVPRCARPRGRVRGRYRTGGGVATGRGVGRRGVRARGSGRGRVHRRRGSRHASRHRGAGGASPGARRSPDSRGRRWPHPDPHSGARRAGRAPDLAARRRRQRDSDVAPGRHPRCRGGRRTGCDRRGGAAGPGRRRARPRRRLQARPGERIAHRARPAARLGAGLARRAGAGGAGGVTPHGRADRGGTVLRRAAAGPGRGLGAAAQRRGEGVGSRRRDPRPRGIPGRAHPPSPG